MDPTTGAHLEFWPIPAVPSPQFSTGFCPEFWLSLLFASLGMLADRL
ncbi:hypothetical protein [uncultured Actinomyces sp.]|nr:hypothetical protein [uncultured Actinomyces sp.]MBF0968898.1 hypothetical protein [Actinomyces sp.]